MAVDVLQALRAAISMHCVLSVNVSSALTAAITVTTKDAVKFFLCQVVFALQCSCYLLPISAMFEI
jgi:hypothetical protein